MSPLRRAGRGLIRLKTWKSAQNDLFLMFKRNVLKRLYGKEEEELDRDVKQQKLKNEESTSIVSSNFGPSKHAIQSRKVYTVTLPPEGLQVIAESSHTLDLHEDEKESTNTDSSGTEEKSALFEREKEKLLEFVDGIWDIILAEGRSKGEFHDDDINLKQKFDEFITDSKPDHFELIQSLWSLKSSALMQDRTLVNTKTENVKSRMREVDYCEVSPSVSIHFCHRCLRASIPLKELLILTGQKAIHCKYEVIIGLKVGTRNGCFQFWE
ncbi:hypothetical protein FSP39_010160 [Pinctada imbricata]|uniref:Uncharacterized protein n=1 Tax=Pinctada imbricata TaxID=66713 RepID=A0AA88XRB7_PINIB|nr:hypothetical protein FSP39_010160 [Pinctada imbricata]